MQYNLVLTTLDQCNERLFRSVTNLVQDLALLRQGKVGITYRKIEDVNLCVRCFMARISREEILCLDCRKEIGLHDRHSHNLMELTPLDDGFKEEGIFRLPKRPTTSLQYVLSKLELLAAMSEQGIIYHDDLLYSNAKCPSSSNDTSFEQPFQVNLSILNIFLKIGKKMSLADTKTFLRFKDLTRRGLYIPITLEKDEKQGYRVRTTENIPRYTLIAEYAGEVDFAINHTECRNDSMMSLLEVQRDPRRSLLICPRRFANLAKFLSGVNKTLPDVAQIENVASIRFDIEGQARVLLYTAKMVPQGTLLYYDYNGGQNRDYPTSSFVHAR